ncbi:unnamed protein product [Symbiodinium natans]|uniref:C3H1-type domain-containing protein n=1 Tax=Symbiodinium natans TaxID=878477 RepID=A0A812NQL8_9DINO|nr:unnamed protein product [Symbiodinium natans]
MPKAEAKNTVKFTRMCKFWKTNECKMGADCTFAHSTKELRPSPKPCFDFVKNGFCARGQTCRFVHEVVEMKTTDKFVEVQHSAINRDRGAEASVLGSYGRQPTVHPPLHMAPHAPLAAAQQMPQFSIPPARQMSQRIWEQFMEPDHATHSPSCIRPPPGLSVFPQGPPGLAAGLGGFVPEEPEVMKTALHTDGDSRRSSLSDLGLECIKLPICKSDRLEQGADEATVATQSLTSTMCLSTTPSSFSEVESPTSFWL